MKKSYHFLVISSTEFEISKFRQKLIEENFINDLNSFVYNQFNIDVLISGIGISQTIYKLSKFLSLKNYDLVINAGICGSFTGEFPIGSCVNVTIDEFADIGMTYADNSFHTLFDEKLMLPNEHPFMEGKLINPFQLPINVDLQQVKSITVNNCSGNTEQIQARKNRFNADVESMEGAAVAYVCLLEKVNYLQIRAISNIIEPRNKTSWEIEKASCNLSECLYQIVNKIII